MPAGAVQVLNVHLRPPSGELLSIAMGGGRLGEIHQREIEALLSKAEPDKPVLVVGDFNEPEGWPATRWLMDQGYESAFSRLDPRPGTCCVRFAGLEMFVAVDHMFHTRRLTCTDAAVIAEDTSDHRPLRAEFRVTPLARR